MTKTMERMTKLNKSLETGLKIINGNVEDFVAFRETYDAEYTAEGLNPVKVCIELSIYMNRSYRKEYPKGSTMDIRTFPNISENLKMILGMYGIFAFIRINANRRLTEEEVLLIEDINFKQQILDTVYKVSKREIPIITSIDINKNTSLFFIKRLLDNPATYDENVFIIGSHGENTIELLDIMKVAGTRLNEFLFTSSNAYFKKKNNT